MAEKKVKLSVVADTSPADKDIDQFKKGVENKKVEVPVHINLSEVVKALHSLQEITGTMQNAFSKDFKFSGLQKEIDNISAKMNGLIKETKEGVSYINVKPMGLQNMKSEISEMTHNIKELNSAKIDLDSFNKLEVVLKNIETILSSIQTGLNLETIRPSVVVQDQIDGLNKSLDELDSGKIDRTIKKFEKLEKFLGNRTAKNVMSTAFGYGELDGLDNVDIDYLEKVMNSMKEYMTLGGDLSKIKFSILNPDTGEKDVRSLMDLLNLLKANGNQEFDSIKITDLGKQIQSVIEARSEIKALNDELERSKLYESRGMNFSLDTKSIEEFSAAMKQAAENFGGLSTENFNSIIGKLDEIATIIKNITDLLSGDFDTFKLNADPKINKDEIKKKIEQQIDDTQVKAKVKTDLFNEEEITGVVTKVQDGFRTAAADLGTDLVNTVDDFKTSLSTLDFDSILSSLRNTLLDIVKQFQNSLNTVKFSPSQFSTSQFDDVYKILKAWNDADSFSFRKANITQGERGAFYNSKTGQISNSFLVDEAGSFSNALFNALKELSVGLDGQISSIYDTWVHAHPFKESISGRYKTIGSDIGFSIADIEVGIAKHLKDNLSKMMVTNNYKFTQLDLSDVSEELTKKFIEEYKKELLKAGLISENINGSQKIVFPKNLATDGKTFNLDKKSEILNNALLKAMSNVGLDNSRLTTGNIEDLSSGLSTLVEQEQKATADAQELVNIFQKLNDLLDGISTEKFQFGISEESLDSIIKKLSEIVEAIDKVNSNFISPEVSTNNGLNSVVSNHQKLQEEIKESMELTDELSSLLSKDFTTVNKTEATRQLKEAYAASKPFFDEYDQTGKFTAAGTKAGYVYYRAFQEAVSKGIATSNLDKYSISKDYLDRSNYVNRYGVTEEFTDASNDYIERMRIFSTIIDEVRAKFGSIDFQFDIFKNTDINDSATVLSYIEEYARAVERLNYMKSDSYFNSFDISLQTDYVESLKKQLMETAELVSELTSKMKNIGGSSSAPSLTQTFDNHYQQDLVYLENYKNTIKEIDKLKLEPQTDEAIQKMRELNELADYYVSHISVIRSEGNSYISVAGLKNSFGLYPQGLTDKYTHDQLEDFYKIGAEKNGLKWGQDVPNFQLIGDEIQRIESKSESLRMSLAQDLIASQTYVEDLQRSFITLVATTEELKTEKSPKWIEAFNEDINRILAKYPELEQFKNKFTESSAKEFINTDGWNNFLSQFPQAQKYLESIGYKKTDGDFNNEVQQIGKLKESVIEVTGAVDTKTRAFQEEEQIVVGTVQREISSLQLLDGQLTDIIGTLEKLQSSSLNLGFKQNSDVDDSILKIFNELNESVNNLNVEALTKVGTSIRSLKVPQDVANNIKEVTIALKEFKENISGMRLEDNNLLSSINAILNKSEELKNLCNILESSERKIKRTREAIREQTKSSEEQGLDETTLKQIKEYDEVSASLRKNMSSLNGSFNGIFKGNAGFDKFNNGLLEVAENYKKILSLTNVDIDYTLFDDFRNFQVDFENKTMKGLSGEGKTEAFVAKLKEAQNNLESIKEIFKKISLGEAVSSEDLVVFEKYINQIRELKSMSSDNTFKAADPTKYQKVLGDLARTMHKNTAMSKELRQEFEALDTEMRSFNGNASAEQLKEWEYRLQSLTTQLERFDRKGLSFFDGVAVKARKMSQSFIAMYFSFYDWIRYIRQSFTILKELDTALTEMRKVSDESVSTLREYQKASFDAASSVGTTGKQIQNSTADWMGIYLVPLYGNI